MNSVIEIVAVVLALSALVWICEFYIWAITKGNEKHATIGIYGFFIIIMCTYGVASVGYEDVNTGRYRYKITVADEDFKKVYDNYDIIEEQDGYYIVEDTRNK